MRWFYIDHSARRTSIRILCTLGIAGSIWLWYGTIQPTFQKRRSRSEMVRQIQTATTDEQRQAAVNFNGRYVVFGDRR